MVDTLYIHSGYKNYLKYSLDITSKKNNIFFIGDDSNAFLRNKKNIEFINRKELLDAGVEKYKSYFINYSTNDKSFEWSCFERVFLMKNFLDKYNIQQIFYSDSDNVFLKNLNKLKLTKNIGYLIPNLQSEFEMYASIHSSFLNKEFCEKFIELYEDIYINKSKFEIIAKKIEYHEKNNIRGGICDMTLYYFLNKFNIIDVQNFFEPVKTTEGSNSIFIQDIKSSIGPSGKDTFKKNKKHIKIFNNTKVLDLTNGEFYELNNIHFQGISKKHLNFITKYKLFFNQEK